MSEERLTAIILAAGKGTRMKSPLPKVLHPVAGRPMIEKMIRACKEAGVHEIRVVTGHGQSLVQSVVEPMGVQCFTQTQQLGTADAVRAAKPEDIKGTVLILNGDHPLIQAQDIKTVLRVFKDEKLGLAVVTADVKDPGSLGRIIRHKGRLHSIVEAKDASADALKIREVNTGLYVIQADVLNEDLQKIGNNNNQGEYYLTDIISIAAEHGEKVDAIKMPAHVAHGVNTQAELAIATRAVFRRKAKQLMEDGVLLIHPQTTFIEESVVIGSGSVIYPNVFIKGNTRIGSYSVVESNSFIIDGQIGDSVQIKAGTYIEKTKIMNKASVGPYARLRPETEIGEEAHVGNFVEMKKVKFGKKAKAGHLTYLGDAEIGEETNIGCGTITCNYAVDKKKYKTQIGARVFVGSDSQFIAPVQIGDDAVIGSGSTITKDVPPKALAVARGKQFIKENYVKDLVQSESSSEENK